MFNILLPPHMRSLHCYQRLPLTDEPIPTHHNYPKCRIYRRFVLGVVRSVDLDQCIRTCLHRLGVTQHLQHPDNPLCSASSFLPIPQSFSNTDLTTVSIGLPLPKCHVVGSNSIWHFQVDFFPLEIGILKNGRYQAS